MEKLKLGARTFGARSYNCSGKAGIRCENVGALSYNCSGKAGIRYENVAVPEL